MGKLAHSIFLWILWWGRGRGRGQLGSWLGKGGCKLSLREGRPLERASTAALITFSPDLISRSGFCNFFQFST